MSGVAQSQVQLLGLRYAWAAQFARVPSVLEEMGLSDAGMSLAFLAGPICGLLVQPVVGTLSDQSNTRCGRRRPWIAASLGVVIASFLVIGDSYAIGQKLGDSGAIRPRALTLAVISFWARFAGVYFVCVEPPMRTKTLDLIISTRVAALSFR